MLIDLVDSSEVREDDETFENGVDLLFKDLEKKDPAWECPFCGKTGNTGKFCTNCGAQKPQENSFGE